VRPAIIALVAGLLPLGAYAHQGLSSASKGPLTRMSGPIEAATYDGAIRINYHGEAVRVALGTPASLKARGLPFSALTPGTQVTLDAYSPSAGDGSQFHARRIVVGRRIFELG
jgi:hypothetical protein